MNKVGVPKLVGGKTAGECLRNVPIMRGWGGEQEPEDWMVVGTGSKLEVVGRQESTISIDGKDIEEEWGDWEEELSREFVQYVRRTKFVNYICPQCQVLI
jgi:hypothetical protein